MLVTIKELTIGIKAGLEASGENGEGITAAIGSTVYPRIAGLLRMFLSKWENWQKLSQRDRWGSELLPELQETAGQYSEELLDIVSLNEGFLDGQVVVDAKTVSSLLREFALAQIRTIGTRDIEALEKKGMAAYEQAKQLLPLVAKSNAE